MSVVPEFLYRILNEFYFIITENSFLYGTIYLPDLMNNIIKIGRSFYSIGIIAFGIQQFIIKE